jgi:hypothetical protein
MNDQNLTCVDCRTEFTFTTGEQEFYNDKGFTPPKRCGDCRDKKKRQREKRENSQY